MAEVMKHVGKFGNKPCVVVFRQVPNEPNNCLIVESGSLPDGKHDELMNVVASLEGQEANDVSEVLARRQFPDGTNILSDLHFSKKLQKVSTDMVFLTPTPNTRIALSEVNVEIGKIATGSNPLLNTQVNPDTLLETQAADRIAEASQPTEADAPSVAENLLIQAELIQEDVNAMLKDADAKRAEAYALDPSLAPKKGPGRPPKADN
jgi:hypothetical protein